ncbi:PDDEXK nuclease domain-containing protein [Pedobacter sp. UYEF25]
MEKVCICWSAVPFRSWETDYYLNLLFFHISLKCYVLIELKNTKFIPEFPRT